MAEAHWEPYAELICLQAEINRDKKKRSKPFTAAEFNPFARSRALPKPPKVKLKMLRKILTSGPFPKEWRS